MMDTVIFLGLVLSQYWSYATCAFFYTFPQIQPQPYYQTPFLINQGYQYSLPATFFPGQLPVTTYYTTHQTFGTSEIGRTQQPTSGQNNGIKTQLITGPTDQFRGFAYHTTYNDGATSNVVFLTGPEARQIQNLETLPRNTSLKSRTLASDLTDCNAIQDENGEIQNTLKNPNAYFNIEAFFKNPQIALQNFYSKNSRVFSDSKYPANTAPLNNPIPIAAFNNAFFSENSTTSASNTTEAQKGENSTEKEVEVAESVIKKTTVQADPVSFQRIDSNTERAEDSSGATTTESAPATSTRSELETTNPTVPTSNATESSTPQASAL